jgi:hypothetical protein
MLAEKKETHSQKVVNTMADRARNGIIRQVVQPDAPKRSSVADCAQCVGECKTF